MTRAVLAVLIFLFVPASQSAPPSLDAWVQRTNVDRQTQTG